MAEIKFLPVCSHCNHILYNELIDYESCKNDYDIQGLSYPIDRLGYITPPICPNCGAIFEAVATHTSLPFKEVRKT